jgi:RNA polymerase sigma factor (sigma-70 family)
MDDLGFVQRCVKGDEATWDEFLEKYSRLIYNYIRNALNTKGYSFTQDHTEDIFQDIFHSLIKDNFKKLRSFQGKNGCSLASWLRQVTINFTIDYLRKIKPALPIEEEREDGLSLKDMLADSSPPATETLSSQENIAALEDCIEKLGNEDKYFLELYIHREIKLEDLKKVLKLSRGAVDMQKARIITRLRDCFKSKGFVFF